jgi:Ser/Thr protein kinase RdoA (MazF antagonist)
MKDYETLTTAGQVRRLRKVAISALANYPLRLRRIWPLHHGHNTTFGVEATTDQAETARFVLRASLPGWRLLPHIEAEAVFLAMLRAETPLVVPRPVPARDGAFVTTASTRVHPGPRHCVLFEWIDGQFFRRRLTPTGLHRLGRFTAVLHNYADSEHDRLAALPRPSVQWERRAGLDGDMARLMDEAFSRGHALLPPARRTLLLEARARIEAVMAELGKGPDVYGLIHADLHQGNVLHYRGEVRAIDFDDGGWGHYLYDLAVTQRYLGEGEQGNARRAAHLEGYRELRPLAREHEALLPVFTAARDLLLACYFASRSDNPRFRRRAPVYVEEHTQELARFLDG